MMMTDEFVKRAPEWIERLHVLSDEAVALGLHCEIDGVIIYRIDRDAAKRRPLEPGCAYRLIRLANAARNTMQERRLPSGEHVVPSGLRTRYDSIAAQAYALAFEIVQAELDPSPDWPTMCREEGWPLSPAAQQVAIEDDVARRKLVDHGPPVEGIARRRLVDEAPAVVFSTPRPTTPDLLETARRERDAMERRDREDAAGIAAPRRGTWSCEHSMVQDKQSPRWGTCSVCGAALIGPHAGEAPITTAADIETVLRHANIGAEHLARLILLSTNPAHALASTLEANAATAAGKRVSHELSQETITAMHRSAARMMELARRLRSMQ